jgi:DNA-nicking Smr family endonuclease
MDESEDEPVEIPISGELDLHTFRPSELGELLPEYFRECRKRGILEVRVIHGKGTGALREGVHRLVERMPEVEAFQHPAGAGSGSWGATWVRLKPLGESGDGD